MLYLKTEVFDWSVFKNIKARRGSLKKNYQLPNHPHLWLWYSIAASQVSGKKSEKVIQKIFTLNNSNDYKYKNHIMKNHLLFCDFPIFKYNIYHRYNKFFYTLFSLSNKKLVYKFLLIVYNKIWESVEKL